MFYEPQIGHGLPHDPWKAIVAPRPIAWVSTLSAAGTANLAPFSYFNAVSDAPPLVMISVAPMDGHGGRKDTLANILETQEMVIHLVPQGMADAMNATSAPLAPDIDEFAHAGLAKAPSALVTPPRIADAPIALEARLERHVALPGPKDAPDRGYGMVIAEVVGVHIADEVLVDGLLDVTRYAPLARLGYRDYTAVEQVFSLTRPKG